MINKCSICKFWVLSVSPVSWQRKWWAGAPGAGKVISSSCSPEYMVNTTSSHPLTHHTGEASVAAGTGCSVFVCATSYLPCFTFHTYPDSHGDRRDHPVGDSCKHEVEEMFCCTQSFQPAAGTVSQKAWEQQIILLCSTPLANTRKRKHQQQFCWGNPPELQLPCLALMLGKHIS